MQVGTNPFFDFLDADGTSHTRAGVRCTIIVPAICTFWFSENMLLYIQYAHGVHVVQSRRLKVRTSQNSLKFDRFTIYTWRSGGRTLDIVVFERLDI